MFLTETQATNMPAKAIFNIRLAALLGWRAILFTLLKKRVNKKGEQK